MKPYFIGLILTVAMTACSRGSTNMTASEPIQVTAGQNFTIKMASNPTTGYGWQLSKALDNKISLATNASSSVALVAMKCRHLRQ